MTAAALLAELQRAGIEASDSALTRALYSSDASLYRVLPQVVAHPRHRDELEPILGLAAAAGVPVTMRGSGTSIAGNAVGPGLVVDTRRLNGVLAIDPDARTAVVEPGLVHAQLQAAAAPYGLRYGPDPSTHTRCTIGGMVGNNACGSRALGYGRTADTLVDAEVLWGDRSAGVGEVEARLARVVVGELAHVRTTFGLFARQVSGYSLEHLLPERLSVPRFLAGSEGTLGVAKTLTVSLVAEEERTLLVLGYPSMADAADAVPALLAAGHAGFDTPLAGARGYSTSDSGGHMVACEGLDSRIVDLVRSRGAAVPELPRGDGWLFIEV
ncbi:MAG TPA: FAD-binding oxidoreductase, partial [Pseudonocardia sp.]